MTESEHDLPGDNLLWDEESTTCHECGTPLAGNEGVRITAHQWLCARCYFKGQH